MTTPLIQSDPQPKPSVINLLMKLVQLVAVAIPSLLLTPLYLVGTQIWYRPPNVPHLGQIGRYLRLTWSASPSNPSLTWQARIWLTLSILRKWAMTPIKGCAWLLDEALYGRKMDAVDLRNPLFVISGGRSGSTQMTRYIEADPSVTAPSLVQSMFPYMWLWRLVPRTIGRFITPAQATERFEALMPPELMERHESAPFQADTFDGAFLEGHLNPLSLYLGPDVSSKEMNFAMLPVADRARLEADYVRLIDRIGRKQLLFSGNPNARLFIKGHFLCVAAALEQHFPDAAFLTLIRDPAKRLQSGINYLRVNPHDPAMGPTPWGWLANSLLRSESDYCRVEQEWYSRSDGATRCVIRFDDFVADLEGTMGQVYRDCFDQDELPPHVPRSHPPRERKNYSVNHSLAELGIDADALRLELADYVAWCQPQPVEAA